MLQVCNGYVTLPGMSTDQPNHAPLVLILIAGIGATSALIGGYWDDAWHTEHGRDSFLIAPHIATYAGIAAAGAALTGWGLLVAYRNGPQAVWAHKPLALGLIAVAVTLGSAPADNLWHVAFGRDAVIWSPPHMLGIAGTLALGAAVLAEVASRRERWAAPATVLAGAMVLTSAAFAAVEYETDVPQFSELWYLPALGLTAAIALAMIRTASRLRWAATLSAAAYTALIGGVGLFLMALEFSPPALPLLVAPALAVDIAARRAWSPAATGAAFAAVLYIVYVPVRNLLGDGVEISAGDVAVGLPLTALACAVVFAIAAGRVRWRRLAVATAALVALALPGSAFGHDPGQGDPAGEVDLAVALDGERATLTAELARDACAETSPRAVVARRAGVTLRAPLEKRGCAFRGSLTLPERGRWFVYAEMERDGRTVETWLPVSVGDGPARVAEDGRYAYFPPERSDSAVKVIAGAALYAGMLALVVAAFALIRRSTPAVS